MLSERIIPIWLVTLRRDVFALNPLENILAESTHWNSDLRSWVCVGYFVIRQIQIHCWVMSVFKNAYGRISLVLDAQHSLCWVLGDLTGHFSWSISQIALAQLTPERALGSALTEATDLPSLHFPIACFASPDRISWSRNGIHDRILVDLESSGIRT